MVEFHETLHQFDIWLKQSNYRYQKQVTTMNDKKELVECKIGLWYTPGQSVGGKSLVELWKEFKNEEC